MAVHGSLRSIAADEQGVSLAEFRDDVLAGLSQPSKAIPARWLYDFEGSQLFEEITDLPEYYPTRTEIGLLRAHACEMAELAGPGRVVVEFGSGSSTKTPLLLREAAPAAYVPLDISGEFLRRSAEELSARFPDLPVVPIEADFMSAISLPKRFAGLPTLGFFPGSTIGNLVPSTAVDCLRAMRKTLGEGGELLIGFDRVKEIETLIVAYDDSVGVTARFNLNLLHRINRELEGDIPAEDFAHEIRWNERWNRIEMHLRALRDLSFTICGETFEMAEGETIHTENSHKYTPDTAKLLLEAAGWEPLESWSDEGEAFLIVLAQVAPARGAP
jgi:L-histidine N-alpha-methyltransferase